MPELIQNQIISYCINQYCKSRENVGENLTHCQSCGAKLLVGDRYRLICRLDKDLNEGYTAKWVYEGIDTVQDDKHVVLKIIDFTRPDWVVYLKREYEFLLSAPRPFYSVNRGDFFEWNPSVTNPHFRTHVLVVPKLEGVDSETWIQENGPLSELNCMEWLFELLPLLETFAEIPAIYRDLTPANIMVMPDDEIQLIDFGSVKIIDDSYLAIVDGNIPNEEGTDIRRGTRIFTPAYAPREQLFGLALPQSDFYSLGRTITYWMTGKSPVDLWEDGGWIDLAKHRPDLTQPFIQFVEWLTQEKPGARPASAKTIRYHLEETYVYLLEAEAERDGFLTRVQKFQRNFLVKSGVASGIVVLALGIVGWLGISNFWYRQGVESLEFGDYRRASQDFSRAHQINPFLNDALKRQAFACIGAKDYDCAERIYTDLLKSKPNDPWLLYQFGFTQEGQNKISQATDAYEKSLTVQPIQIESHLRLSRIAIESKDYLTAHNQLNQAQKIYQEHPTKRQPTDTALINYYQGWLALEEGKPQLAQKHLNQALESLTADDIISIASGDILCLLATSETAMKESFDTLMGTWSGCFSSPTRTPEGMHIRDQKIQSSLKNSLR